MITKKLKYQDFWFSLIKLDTHIQILKLEGKSAQLDLPLFAQAMIKEGLISVHEIIATKSELCFLTSDNKLNLITKKWNEVEFNKTIPTKYEVQIKMDNPLDKLDVERQTQLSWQKCKDLFLHKYYRISHFGFSPGFFYLEGIDQKLQLKRKSIPNPLVPKNSIAIGGPYSGIYPSEGPGGWHIIGTLVDDDILTKQLWIGDLISFFT